eukprot:maker-scaffold927_size80360-snap-gene-0.26 protein:Tk12218 transcript:maker-scaffold927_size80360-snap-gene-0.26-mRNA-1 annotation:"hypothetical protein DAPPUDRAFT_324324"
MVGPVSLSGLSLVLMAVLESGVHLGSARKINLGPSVDPGVFVITQVDTCRGGRGYCVLGFNCNIDKDFVADDLGGHCDGLGRAFNPITSFVCCRENPANFNVHETAETTTTTSTTSTPPRTVTELVTSIVTELSTVTELVTRIEQVTEIQELTTVQSIIPDATTAPTIVETTPTVTSVPTEWPMLEDETTTKVPADVMSELEMTTETTSSVTNTGSVMTPEPITEASGTTDLDALVSSVLDLLVPIKLETPSEPVQAPPLPLSAVVHNSSEGTTTMDGAMNAAEITTTETLRPGMVIDDPSLFEDLMEEKNENLRPRIEIADDLVQVIGDFQPQFYNPKTTLDPAPSDTKGKVDCYAAILLGIDCETKDQTPTTMKEKLKLKEQNSSASDPIMPPNLGHPEALVSKEPSDVTQDMPDEEGTTEEYSDITTTQDTTDELFNETITTSDIALEPERDESLPRPSETSTLADILEETTTASDAGSASKEVTTRADATPEEDLTPLGIVPEDEDKTKPSHIDLPIELLKTDPTSIPLTSTEATQEIKSAYRRIVDKPPTPGPECGVLGGKGLLQAFGKVAQGLLPDLVASWVSGQHGGGKNREQSEYVGGGVVTSTVIYCWMAAVVAQTAEGRNEFVCTGTLVKQDLVVVSASCAMELVTRNPSDIKVVVGDSNLNLDLPFGVQVLDVSMIHIHDQYRPYESLVEHNLGLIHLKVKATLTNTVCLLCLPPSLDTQELPLDSPCSIISYGKIVDNPIDLPFEVTSKKSIGVLRKSEYVIQDAQRCNITLSPSTVQEGVLCARQIEDLSPEKERQKREHCNTDVGKKYVEYQG